MKSLHCQCGQTVFYDNTHCKNCERLLGFKVLSGTMVSLEPISGQRYRGSDGSHYALCNNRVEFNACNGVVPALEGIPDAGLCFCCGMNRTIPNLGQTQNLKRWRKLERAKRRLITGLSDLGLAVVPPPASGWPALHFDFLEDQRSNPGAPEAFVTTGHRNGLVTVNVMEADEVQRVSQRELSSERYRTLLGHFRHEAGHYFYYQLVTNVQEFTDLFGNPGQDYEAALQQYYSEGPPDDWQDHFISAYASSHPLEDWAESFAHYLHMHDMLQTALARGVLEMEQTPESLQGRLAEWAALAVTANELNHSLGLDDAYPFVVTQGTTAKFEFIERTVTLYRERTQADFR